MSKNPGKVFEASFFSHYNKDSILVYRLRDNPGAWGGKGLKYTTSNICDFIVFKTPKLFFLELKTTQDKSFSYDKIRESQIKGLLEVKKYPQVIAGVVINFSQLEETYFIDIEKFVQYKNTEQRKSIPVSYLRDQGIKISQQLKRTKYKFGVDEFVESQL